MLGAFIYKKEYCLILFIWQLLWTKHFLSIYIKVGLASYTQLLVLVYWLIVVNMARQADRLAKIGLEGFAAIDEHFGHQLWRFPMPIPHFTTFIRQTKFLQQNLSTATRQRNSTKGKPVPF